MLRLMIWVSIVCLVCGGLLAGDGCAAKMPPSYQQGYQDGYNDYDSANFERAEVERMIHDADYRRGYRSGIAEREREKEEKKGGLWGFLSRRW